LLSLLTSYAWRFLQTQVPILANRMVRRERLPDASTLRTGDGANAAGKQHYLRIRDPERATPASSLGLKLRRYLARPLARADSENSCVSSRYC
jgi:hypothetical protein